jgi:hypothetical protein
MLVTSSQDPRFICPHLVKVYVIMKFPKQFVFKSPNYLRAYSHFGKLEKMAFRYFCSCHYMVDMVSIV